MNLCFRTFAVAAFLVFLVFPNPAKADSFEYTVTSFPDGQTATFTESSLASSGDVTSFLSTTGAQPILEFGWNSAGGDCINGSGTVGTACGGINFGGGEEQIGSFALGSFLSPGTYQSHGLNDFLNMTVTITDVSGVPEPSSLTLMLLGVGLALVMRKRIGQGLSQAS
jgi:hypothetical protein